jgi:NAD(P)H dehydrogenase (quinone)
MKTLIVYCHPHDGSHNHKILNCVLDILKETESDYKIVDLYKDNFDPLLRSIEYERAFITRDKQSESDVKQHQSYISDAENLVFIYPVWWYSLPALLKGYIDRVYAAGFAYKFFRVHPVLQFGANILSYVPGLRYFMQTRAVTPLLKGKRAFIFRTYGGPSLGKRIFGNTQKVLDNCLLRFCGVTDVTVHELYNVNKSVYSEAYEKKYLAKARKIARSIASR